MRYVVTGATGFIGAEFILTLLNAGNTVYAIGRNETKARTILPVSDSLNFVKAELSEFKDLDSKIPEADVFVNFSWDGITVSGRDMTDVQKLNIQYAKEAMQAAKRMGCSLFVETGSQAEYGIVNEVISEDTPCNPFSEYGKAKLKVKECGFQFSEKYNLKYMHLRIFSMIGENDHPWTLVMSALDKMLANESIDLSTCTQNWNFIYVKDAVRIIVRLCENAIINENFLHEVYNIASNDTRVLKCFVERMKELTCSSSRLNYGVNIPNKIVSLQPNITKSIKDSGFDDFHNFDEVINRIIENKRQYD